MSIVKHKTRPIRVCVVSIALNIAVGTLSTSLQRLSAQAEKASGTMYSSKRMTDGKQWTTHNLDVNTMPSYCYEDAELNCRRYGRLYTWESARRVCQSLRDGWRLPTDEEWWQMAKDYGGVSEDSDNRGKAAYKALLAGGGSGFNALLGGGRSDDGHYARLEAHGFYWTASESDPASGWFYNFARGGQALHRQSGGEKQRAFSVRCVRE
ncbi:MAG TPA: FISUMP domain-containing protein [Pyrinomonadaceae bacterium]|nr:FISUMP domain-containing protein [Pyrinomonadaceae bacterium]